MRRLLIHILGGFYSIEEAIEAIETTDDKHHILTKAVSDVFNTIGENDVLQFKKGNWYYQGRILEEEEVHTIRTEAKTFRKYRIYEVLDNEIKYHAHRNMFYKSQNVDDIMASKMVEYVWDIIKTKLKQLS